MTDEVTVYDITYLGILCEGVCWKTQTFYFVKDDKHYKFEQLGDISCSADTDHIKRVIKEQFLPWLKSLESMQKWISVEERLPEMNLEHPHECDVLVYVPKREGIHQHGIYIGARGKVKGDPKGERNFWGVPTQECDWVIRGWSYFEHPIVTHWMPLPKAPILEEEQTDEART